MAAPMSLTLSQMCVKTRLLCHICAVQGASARSAFFWKKKSQEEGHVRKPQIADGSKRSDELQSLAARGSIRTRKAYTPPKDLEARIKEAVYEACQERVNNWKVVDIKDARLKFKILTRLMNDLDHVIPNMELNNMKTMDDVVEYFSVPVKDTSSYEDLKKLDLPRNLHIQLDPLRFDPETDTMFGGRSAFPGRETTVTSLRYTAKYGKKEK